MTKDILYAHFADYPAMQPQDAVKLLYQMEFGPEHLIKNPEKSLANLRQEMAGLAPKPGEKMYEPIGNGLCRWNLRPCLARQIPPEDINRLLVETARGMQGDKRHLQQLLHELEEMAEADETPFEAIELDVFLIQYRDLRCPAVHHSPEYRAAYQPAYRVVSQRKLKDYLKQRRDGQA